MPMLHTLEKKRTQNRSTGNRRIHSSAKDIYISSVTDADLKEEEIFDSLTFLSWYIHRFLKSLVRHIFPATKLIAEANPRIITKLPETLHHIYMTKNGSHKIL